MVWTDSQDYGVDEILYTARTVLFNKTNQLMREITILFGVSPQLFPVVPEPVKEQIYIMRQYEGYIKQEEIAAERAKRDEQTRIPHWLDYDKCAAVRFESREKLKKWRPETLAQASRIPGVNPADIAVLAVIIHRGRH